MDSCTKFTFPKTMSTITTDNKDSKNAYNSMSHYSKNLKCNSLTLMVYHLLQIDYNWIQPIISDGDIVVETRLIIKFIWKNLCLGKKYSILQLEL